MGCRIMSLNSDWYQLLFISRWISSYCIHILCYFDIYPRNQLLLIISIYFITHKSQIKYNSWSPYIIFIEEICVLSPVNFYTHIKHIVQKGFHVSHFYFSIVTFISENQLIVHNQWKIIFIYFLYHNTEKNLIILNPFTVNNIYIYKVWYLKESATDWYFWADFMVKLSGK